MNTQHTPGPWKAVQVVTHVELGHFAPPAHFQIHGEICEGSSATLVCSLPPYGKENKANARLIASAPELLAALQALLAHEGERDTSGIGTEHDSLALEQAKAQAQAAIAKATEKGAQ